MTACPSERHREPKASCPATEDVRKPDPESQGPWEFSFAFSPASQSVYFTCLFNIYMNQGNIIS